MSVWLSSFGVAALGLLLGVLVQPPPPPLLFLVTDYAAMVFIYLLFLLNLTDLLNFSLSPDWASLWGCCALYFSG